MRASRETELEECFPSGVVAEWLGNSLETALAHDTQVTEEHYQRALQNPVQQPAAAARTEQQKQEGQTADGEEGRELAICCDSSPDDLMTPTGFERTENPSGKQADQLEGGAKSGAFSARSVPERSRLESLFAALKGLSPPAQRPDAAQSR